MNNSITKDRNDKKAKKKSIEEFSEKNLEHSYFKGHQCSIPNDYNIKCGKLRKFILYLTTVRSGDIRARHMYRSYSELSAEIQNHYLNHPFAIHPFSRLRVAIEILSIVLFITCSIVNAIYAAGTQFNSYCVFVVTVCEALFFVNILSNFFTGYVDGNTAKHVVLNLNKIIWRYARSWLIIDLMYFFGCFVPNEKNVHVDCTTVLVKVLKLPTLFEYTSNLMKIMEFSAITKTAVEVTLLISNYLCWNIQFQFYVEYVIEGTYFPDNPNLSSWMTISHMWNSTWTRRLTLATNRAVGMLRQNSNLHLLKEGGRFENFFIISWIVGKVVVIHSTIKYMIMRFGQESARAKYFMMALQVKAYVNQRKFPDRIKKKILQFYAVRFQSFFFVESRMMDCVSGQLREDIIMHSGRQLVSHVAFLKHLPRSLHLQIGTKLKVVIFLAGDIIFKINTLGDCLYFIDKGTVAIYSESGKEIGHLKDGDYFGAIALVMKHRFRTTSVVAVTNCELFQLDRKDFESTIAVFPTVIEMMKKEALHRLERATVIDEHHKAELRMGKENRDSE
ncbi:potassium/sodium hyperpolarization-activated cyclic nucleotide-gated channel 3-like [Pectinophora gossypiella]|uniref:potassium/sodium hyperpolarization-activated cyclic nucleotide-gated channel 3-like n=1 Tax=Pectinophora gossypiella TaxID=13191 RepID=UPI00214E8991|nr:potassium/sodium hyperpolarization-activated cyclic nucleotide-gated channel 3-like [Pectinophora gossypiella]